MALAAGTRLGRYEVRSQLGAGGMGEVYLAHDTTELERMVAVKVLPSDMAADPERMRRFVQEAKTASSLNHPNILTVYEVGEVNSAKFIATEFVEGETLRQKMTRSRLSLREALDVAIQIASALVAAHKAGIVHRDIKPENLMVREDGILKVLDFGLAKPTGRPTGQLSPDSEAATRALVNTSPGMIMGTISYMSPEQARGLAVDERTDIWSLGVVIYEMVSGRVPFAGKTTSDVLAHVLTKEPAALSVTSERANERLDEIIQKALTKDREERYQHVKDLLIDLKRLKQKLDVEAEIERTQTPEQGTALATTGAGRDSVETVDTPAARISELGGAHPTSSAEYVVSEIKRHKSGVVVVLATLVVAIAAASYFYFGKAAINSIAVLPFANAGGDPNMEYLSDGMTESLINSLSQLPNLAVKARSTMFRYKGKEADPQKVGAELNVQAVLNGHIVERDDDLTLSLELVDAKTGDQMWGKQYNRKLTDLVALQSEIARDVSNKLRIKSSGADERRMVKSYTGNAEAYRLYLLGRFYWNRRTAKDLQKSIEYFHQAVALDPNYALAYAGLADAYTLLPTYGGAPSHEVLPKAREAASRALSLDNQLAEAHISLGLVLHFYDYDVVGAEREFKAAIELNPNSATAHQFYGNLLAQLGRDPSADAELRRALEIEPLLLTSNRIYGVVLLYARKYDEAIAQLKKTLELDASFAPAYDSLAHVYFAKGSYAESVEEFAKSQELFGQPQNAMLIRKSFARGGWHGFLQAMTGESRPANLAPYRTATFHAALGEKDKAFGELNKAYENREFFMMLLKVDPRLDPLRSDQRFAELMRRVGLPQ